MKGKAIREALDDGISMGCIVFTLVVVMGHLVNDEFRFAYASSIGIVVAIGRFIISLMKATEPTHLETDNG